MAFNTSKHTNSRCHEVYQLDNQASTIATAADGYKSLSYQEGPLGLVQSSVDVCRGAAFFFRKDLWERARQTAIRIARRCTSTQSESPTSATYIHELKPFVLTDLAQRRTEILCGRLIWARRLYWPASSTRYGTSETFQLPKLCVCLDFKESMLVSLIKRLLQQHGQPPRESLYSSRNSPSQHLSITTIEHQPSPISRITPRSFLSI